VSSPSAFFFNLKIVYHFSYHLVYPS